MLKLLKMATGMRALLDTVVQALPQVPHTHTHTVTNTVSPFFPPHRLTLHIPTASFVIPVNSQSATSPLIMFLCWPVGNSNRWLIHATDWKTRTSTHVHMCTYTHSRLVLFSLSAPWRAPRLPLWPQCARNSGSFLQHSVVHLVVKCPQSQTVF